MPRQLTRGAFKKKNRILPPSRSFKLSIFRSQNSSRKNLQKRIEERDNKYSGLKLKRAFLRFHDSFGRNFKRGEAIKNRQRRRDKAEGGRRGCRRSKVTLGIIHGVARPLNDPPPLPPRFVDENE